ncbi:NAD(P)/FAD-dependent oxidoreductase [Puniceicoccus vermicola]|uniref:NAD(P)/FAD-dependent oxidoreductase n=2 Tax=Puniceicoccus vermicola TaxID=388746 RepID=A0A7X1AZZ6_9BACT|nr:NAD(P)/FAD-dependent oxidoreductase [Puniceicoccus vermicola]
MDFDVIIIGGSFAGLSAALYIARARRSVCIVDKGSPRNRFADHSHGLLGMDGVDPQTILTRARKQLTSYPSVHFIDKRAVEAKAIPDGFSVKLSTERTFKSSRLILAYGLSDQLPTIPGLQERWGKTVLHCPYCHGYEFSDRHLGVLYLSSISILQAIVVSDWGPTTLYLNGESQPEEESLAQLHERGIEIEPAPVTALQGEGESLAYLELEDGRHSPVDALYIAPATRQNSDLAQQLGCEFEEGPFGEFIKTNEERMTTVPGVFAAGDIARPKQNATWATADGVTVGVAAHHSFLF